MVTSAFGKETCLQLTTSCACGTVEVVDFKVQGIYDSKERFIIFIPIQYIYIYRFASVRWTAERWSVLSFSNWPIYAPNRTIILSCFKSSTITPTVVCLWSLRHLICDRVSCSADLYLYICLLFDWVPTTMFDSRRLWGRFFFSLNIEAKWKPYEHKNSDHNIPKFNLDYTEL